ncbi:hypothetical protein B0T11DRAFT_354774 [Plectosphaerella cucumerina]|uniref:Myb-like domain-containing protein n=1 Tax=Plectosphaerella cucumerina TaxID=40658 RepID=A0A8K0X0Z5_9PEZI|nr:hypothetical protein B0T11DRAFT_354774 [Plectosphaerella cucumerina]
MVSTRSSNRSSQLSGPVAASEPDPLSAARSRRRQSQPMRGTRSSIGPGFETIDEEGPEYEPRASMSSPGALALAHRYGTPARRAAPMPFEAVSLSQLTAHSSVQDNSYQDNPFQGDVETISSDDESSVITVTPEPRSAQAPPSMTRTPVAEAPAFQADIEDEPEEASRSPSPNESQANSQAESLPDADTIELRRTCIEDLAQATKKLVETLYSETLSPNVRNSRLIKIRRPAFDGLREVYDSDEQFIDVPAIFDSLGPDPPKGALRIICQANLAKIIDILVVTHVPSELGRLAKLLDAAQFPEPYTPSPGQNDVDLEAVDYAMDIRIQSFLATLATNPRKDRRLKKKTWLEWVTEAFCTRDNDFDDEEFVEGDMADICGIPHPLPEPIAQLCLAKLNAMLEIAESDGSTVASVIETLSTAYPVSEWRASLLNYAFEKFFGMDEEEEKEESQHGSEEPDARPEDQLEGRTWVQPVDSEEPVPDQDDEPMQDQDQPILGQDEESDVQEEDQPGEEPQDDPRDEPEEELENPEDQASTNPQNKYQPVEIQDSDEESPAPSDAPAQRIIRRPESTAALPFNREMVSFLHDDSPAPPPPRAPENRQGFLSRLASRGEARIEASQSRAEAGTPASSAVSNNDRKRRRQNNDEDEPLQGPGDDEQEEDNDEEDEFEIDARQPDERRRRNIPPPPKRPRTAQNPPPASAPPARPQPRPAVAEEEDPFATPPARSVRPPSASQPPAGDRHPDFVAIHQANRLRAAEARPQHRVPWSNEDTLKLIDFIAEHNCAWVAIYEAANPVPKRKSRDQRAPPFDPAVHFSSLRNQQAIRDKARNLKVDFLKADLVLPVGFDNIVLGKKEIDILTSRNKNPDRLEADIDARGVPTNTYWESW